jgi:hypothetical protein
LRISLTILLAACGTDDSRASDIFAIGGVPNSGVKPGEAYVFRPRVDGWPGGEVVYAISHVPTWATFEPATGELRGEPRRKDIGLTSNIVISATDGVTTAQLPPFSIYVAESFWGVMTVSWQAPTHNVDGTPLGDLAGYRIYYGRETGMYARIIDVAGPETLTLTIDDLPPNTYYVTATAYDRDGFESDLSNEIVRQVN